MKKVNLKMFQHGKRRIYLPVSGSPNITRILIWDVEKREYLPPKRGKLYYARRYQLDEVGKKKRKLEYFESLAAARDWQSFCEVKEDFSSRSQSQAAPERSSGGPVFGSVVLEWKQRKYAGFAPGTRVHYDQLIELHLTTLMDVPVRRITPQIVDGWLAQLKAAVGKTSQSRSRKSFDHELALLTIILRYYDEYADDPQFRLPIKKRHRVDSKLKGCRPVKPKDLSAEEFFRFRSELEQDPNGSMLAPLASTQFFQALRIS